LTSRLWHGIYITLLRLINQNESLKVKNARITPRRLYCGRENVFVIDRELTIGEQLRGVTPKGPFQVACERLGIEVIVAYSPQVKGFIERDHTAYQDRFVKALI